MKKLFYSFVLALIINSLVFSPIYASLAEQEAFSKKVLVTSLVELSQNRLNDNVDPIKEHEYSVATKEEILRNIEGEISRVKDPAITVEQVRDEYLQKTIANADRQLHNFLVFLKDASDIELDAIYENARKVEGYENLLADYDVARSERGEKLRILSEAVTKEFRVLQKNTMEKISGMTKEEFHSELLKVKELVLSKEFDWITFWQIMGYVLLVGFLIFLLALPAGGGGDGYEYDECIGWRTYDTYRDYHCEYVWDYEYGYEWILLEKLINNLNIPEVIKMKEDKVDSEKRKAGLA